MRIHTGKTLAVVAACVALSGCGTYEPSVATYFARSPVLTAHTKACRTTAPDQPADPEAIARARAHRSSQTPRPSPAAITNGHRRP